MDISDIESNVLEVKPSSIPTAGLGLFAKQRITLGAVVCVYTGRCLRTVEALRIKRSVFWGGAGAHVLSENKLQYFYSNSATPLTVEERLTLGSLPLRAIRCAGLNASCRTPDKSYLMRLGPQAYVDALEHPEVMARYINDCRNASLYNVAFEKLPQEGKALVVALKAIEPGDEIFVDYGRWYWLSLKPTALSRSRSHREAVG